jgi:hypothetical protein
MPATAGAARAIADEYDVARMIERMFSVYAGLDPRTRAR